MTLEATDEARPDEPEQHQSDPVLMRTVAAAAAQARLLRTVLADWGRACGLPDELIEDLTLASYEALANVIEHAYPARTDGTMRLVARRSAGRVTVTISDTGHWREAASPPGRGHGLRLIRALAPDTTITTSPTGTTVRLTWPQGTPPPRPPRCLDTVTTHPGLRTARGGPSVTRKPGVTRRQRARRPDARGVWSAGRRADPGRRR